MEKGDSTDSSIRRSKRKGSNSLKAMKKRQKTAIPWPNETAEEDKYPLGPPAQKAEEIPSKLKKKKKRHNHKNRRAKEVALSAANKIAREKQAEYGEEDTSAADKQESTAAADEEASDAKEGSGDLSK